MMELPCFGVPNILPVDDVNMMYKLMLVGEGPEIMQYSLPVAIV